jgi:hypothetical protein
MKKTGTIIFGILLFGMLAGTAMAVDIQTLDKVSVLMSKADVHTLLGNPDEVVELGNGLNAEIYKVTSMEPMVGAGCLYQADQRLAGQAFVFQGKVDKVAAERLQKLGFTVLEDSEGAFRLLGKDDDTGQPLVATITLNNGMTVIMTFEKGFYDRMVAKP